MRIFGLIIGWAILTAVFYLSVLAPYRAPDLGDIAHQDKIYHFIAYFGLMFWFAQIYAAKHRWAIALAILLFGIAIEFIQPYTGRDFDLWDMLANGSGILLAWTLSHLGGDMLYRRWFSNNKR